MNKLKEISDLHASGRLGRISKALLERTDQATAAKIIAGFEEFDASVNPTKKAAWIKQMIQRMENICSQSTCYSTMESCGRKCCGPTSRKRARQIWDRSGSLDEFLAKMNQAGIGGGRMKLIAQDTISAGYDKCYCGQVSRTKDTFPTLTYCQCSAGWYKQLFAAALGMEVEVKLVSSIISGGERCEFIIQLP